MKNSSKENVSCLSPESSEPRLVKSSRFLLFSAWLAFRVTFVVPAIADVAGFSNVAFVAAADDSDTLTIFSSPSLSFDTSWGFSNISRDDNKTRRKSFSLDELSLLEQHKHKRGVWAFLNRDGKFSHKLFNQLVDSITWNFSHSCWFVLPTFPFVRSHSIVLTVLVVLYKWFVCVVDYIHCTWLTEQRYWRW